MRWSASPRSPTRCAILGTGRGGKPREEVLRGAALEPHVGRRARKGRRQDAMQKAMRVVAASNA